MCQVLFCILSVHRFVSSQLQSFEADTSVNANIDKETEAQRKLNNWPTVIQHANKAARAWYPRHTINPCVSSEEGDGGKKED